MPLAPLTQTVLSLHMHRSFSAKNKPAMDNKQVKIHCIKERRYYTWKRCIPRNTRMFIYVLICHVSFFQVPQLYNKLHKIDMSCLAHHIDICFGLKWTSGLIIYASYIFHMFIYISSSDKWQYIIKNKCKIHKNTLLSVLLRHGLPLAFEFFISQEPSHFFKQSSTYAFICVKR
jgi:hypothetical protein